MTYLNGTLQFWGKQSDNTFAIIDSVETPALQVDYKLCKSLAHISVMVNRILQSIHVCQNKTNQHEEDLLKIKEQLSQLLSSDEQSIDPYRTIVELFITVIDKTIQTTCLNELYDMQLQFQEKIKLINEEYAIQATKLQLTGIDEAVSRWIKNKELHKIRVIIAVAAGPKKDLIEGQYFHSLFSNIKPAEPEEGHHYVTYVEMLPKQLNTISSHCLIEALKEKMFNQSIAELMLNDPEAMNRDVLGAYAPAVLKNLCPYKKSASGHHLSSGINTFFINLKIQKSCLPNQVPSHAGTP